MSTYESLRKDAQEELAWQDIADAMDAAGIVEENDAECMWCSTPVKADALVGDWYCSEQCQHMGEWDNEQRMCLNCLREYDGPVHGQGYCSPRCEYEGHGEL